MFQFSAWNPVQVIRFEIDCAFFYTNFHELFCQFISWTNLLNSGKFLKNCWISCEVMADKKIFYDNLTILNKRIIRFRLHLAFFFAIWHKEGFWNTICSTQYTRPSYISKITIVQPFRILKGDFSHHEASHVDNNS